MATATYYLREYDRYTENLLTTFSRFDKRTFNLAPAANKWSPGQVIDHLLRSERGTLRLMNGPTVIHPGREAMTKDKALEAVIETKQLIETMPGLHPTEDHYALGETLDSLADSRAEIRIAFDFANDIAAVSEVFTHPIFGQMSICEWLYFTAIHGERHRRQYAELVDS